MKCKFCGSTSVEHKIEKIHQSTPVEYVHLYSCDTCKDNGTNRIHFWTKQFNAIETIGYRVYKMFW